MSGRMTRFHAVFDAASATSLAHLLRHVLRATRPAEVDRHQRVAAKPDVEVHIAGLHVAEAQHPASPFETAHAARVMPAAPNFGGLRYRRTFR